jgi:hypothetical protein
MVSINNNDDVEEVAMIVMDIVKCDGKYSVVVFRGPHDSC